MKPDPTETPADAGVPVNDFDPERDAIQHARGKLTARERLSSLLDAGSFSEIDALLMSHASAFGMEQKGVPGDGVITGSGTIHARKVFIYSQDFTVLGGSLGEVHGRKISHILSLAKKAGCPVIGIIDSGGARIHEGIASLDGYASIFQQMTALSGIVPQIRIVLGPSAGGASYDPGLSDFVFMVDGISYMFITGPEVVRSVTGETVTAEELGGAKVHGTISGCAHFICSSERDCFSAVRRLLSYLPQNNRNEPPVEAASGTEADGRNPTDIVPADPAKVYDVRDVLSVVFDRYSFFEIQETYAANVVIGFARLAGRVVGVVANQPDVLAGVMDTGSSNKIVRFVRFCDAFALPIINIVDTPGFLPGIREEHGGIIRHGAAVITSYAQARVPRIAVITRKAFGGTYIALASRHLGYDAVFAWPYAEIGVIGAEQAARIIFRHELADCPLPGQLLQKRAGEIRRTIQDPAGAARSGHISGVIEPGQTRDVLIQCLATIPAKRKR